MQVVEKAKSVLLKLKDPNRVLDTIPSAKWLEYKGTGVVLVRHRLDETRVLRNLGIKVPSPILHYYEWAGNKTPFAHQRDTAAFLTMHQRCLVLNEIGCVDADTEYLSPTGWKRIADYEGGAVAQYHPETGAIEYVANPEFVKLPCDEMIRIKTKYGVDQLLSPEHRVLYVSSTGGRMVRQAAEIYSAHQVATRGWKGRFITTFNTRGGLGIPLTDAELRVQVALMADGYFPPTIPSGKRVQLRLKRARKQERIVELLTSAGIRFTKAPCKSEGFIRYSFVAPIKDKSYGDWAWAATEHQLRIICDEVGHWDGSQRKAGATEFFTRDRASADFIQYAFAATGRTASISENQRDNGVDFVVHARASAALLYACGDSRGEKTETMWAEPSTDGFKYCFMVPSTFLVLRRNGCIFATGNTGKTMSALWAADYLMSIGAVRKVLIMSPLSTLERVWGDEIFKNLLHRQFVVMTGAASRRHKLLAQDVDFYIINHEGFPVIGDECYEMFDLVIVDEAAVYRNPSSKRFKYFYRWLQSNPDTRLWLMTGTPTPESPINAWTLARLVSSPNCTSSYTRFREQVMVKIGQWKWVPRPEAVDIVKNILQPAVRFTRDECLDMPETVVQTRHVDLSPTQQQHYKAMLKSLITQVAGEGQITAVNEAVKLMKLLQIVCGVAYGDGGEIIELDATPRVNLVREVIEEAGEKVIVFVPLTGTLHMLQAALSKHWTVAVVHGDTPVKQRDQIFHDFQNTENPRVLIAHPGCMAHGLTLTAANTIVWYGPVHSNETYVQANGRIERIGKRYVSNVVHIESTELERRVYDRLRNKQKIQGLLLDLVREETRK
jgi:hypothetical protein